MSSDDHIPRPRPDFLQDSQPQSGQLQATREDLRNNKKDLHTLLSTLYPDVSTLDKQVRRLLNDLIDKVGIFSEDLDVDIGSFSDFTKVTDDPAGSSFDTATILPTPSKPQTRLQQHGFISANAVGQFSTAKRRRRQMSSLEKRHMKDVRELGGACDACKRKKKKCSAEHKRPLLSIKNLASWSNNHNRSAGNDLHRPVLEDSTNPSVSHQSSSGQIFGYDTTEARYYPAHPGQSRAQGHVPSEFNEMNAGLPQSDAYHSVSRQTMDESRSKILRSELDASVAMRHLGDGPISNPGNTGNVESVGAHPFHLTPRAFNYGVSPDGTGPVTGTHTGSDETLPDEDYQGLPGGHAAYDSSIQQNTNDFGDLTTIFNIYPNR